MNVEPTIFEPDELKHPFVFSDYGLLVDLKEEIKDGNLPINEVKAVIEDFRSGHILDSLAANQVQLHFLQYAMYRLVNEDLKASEQIESSHRFYIENTVSYQWENAVYRAYSFLFGNRIVPDCILPNNRRPDIVMDPDVQPNKYHARGIKITRAKTIIDAKTSIYGFEKERRFYSPYCDRVILVTLQASSKGIKDKNFDEITSDMLIEQIQDANGSLDKKSELIHTIEDLKERGSIDFHEKEFQRRFEK